MSKLHRVLALVAAGVLAWSASPSQAGSTVLGTSGWMASWASSFDGDVAVNVLSETSNSVVIEKLVTFRQGPAANGIFPPIQIVFQQIQADAAVNIVLDQELVTNQTSGDWTGFRMTLLGGAATFDAAQTGLLQPGGFDITPFTSGSIDATNQIFEVGGTTIPVGGTWNPGAASGALWTVTTPAGPDAELAAFALSEAPLGATVIPLPGALGMGLAGLATAAALRRARK